MFTIHNGSDTVIIIVHEIYGVNQHIVRMCQSLSAREFDVICPNLLKRDRPFAYSEEDAAYRYFMGNIGIEHGASEIKKVIKQVKEKYRQVLLVGFSVGATIAWLCSSEEGVDGVVGYYGSRIRNYVQFKPSCKTLLFFPSVDELIFSLEKRNVRILQLEGEHGFSDPYSSKYHAESKARAFQIMNDFFYKNVY